MKIIVDADALPGAVKEILFRAAERVRVPLTLVANKPLATPRSNFISSLIVSAGPDVADDRIVKMTGPGDLVITADIPLADRVVAKGASAIDPRGEIFTANNIRERLSLRDFMDSLRGSGVITGGPAAFSQRDRQAFAAQLDRFLTKYGQADHLQA